MIREAWRIGARRRLAGAAIVLLLPAEGAQAQAPTGAAAWIERLRAADFRRRLGASYDYRDFAAAPAASVPVLVAALGDRDGRVREHVAAALGEVDAAAGARVGALLQAMRDPDPAVQSQAALALAKIGAPAADRLVDALLAPAQLSRPRTEALLWEDYAFAALGLMEEKAAPAMSRALIVLTGRDIAGPPPTEAIPSPVEFEGQRPALAGTRLKLAMFTRFANGLGPAGARAVADALLTAAPAKPAAARMRLDALAADLLSYYAVSDSFVDSDPARAVRLANFLLTKPGGDFGYGAPRLGDVSLLLVGSLLSANRSQEAAGLIAGVKATGALAERWVTILEASVQNADPNVRQAAVKWLARNEDDALPVSRRLLLSLAQAPDAGDAAVAASYLAHLGDRSPELVEALTAILERPQLPDDAHARTARAVVLFGAAASPAEPALARAALAEAADADARSCAAIEALAAVGARGADAQAALIAAVRQPRCGPAAIAALKALGLSRDEIALRARSTPGAPDPQVDALLQAWFDGDPDRYRERTVQLPDESGPALSEDEVLEMLRRDDVLGRRHEPRSYGNIATIDAGRPAVAIEAAAGNDVSQSSPLFAALADLRIFELVQTRVGGAARLRVELANPERPPAAGAAYQPDYTRLLPRWPWDWPPPRYSAWAVMDTSGLPSGATVGLVFNRLERALESNGYYENRLYGVPSGVAVVTHLEQTTPAGDLIPGRERFSYGPTELPRLTFVRYMTEAFMGIRSHYRLFAFFLARQDDISGGTATFSYDEAREPSVDGARILPPEIARLPWRGFYLHAVVYRFRKLNSTVTPVFGDLPSELQLRKAGIAFALRPRP